jgi:hypothetical protein
MERRHTRAGGVQASVGEIVGERRRLESGEVERNREGKENGGTSKIHI